MVDSPAEGVYNCTKCDQISKTKDEFHEHYGLKHNVIENCLTEMGIDINSLLVGNIQYQLFSLT